MRRLFPAAALLIAGCATTPQPQPQPTPQPTLPQPPQVRSELLGLSSADLVQRFGTPALQIREGASVKLQFRGSACVLDAYLYPPASGGVERVTHVDARLRSGAPTDQLRCISALSAP